MKVVNYKAGFWWELYFIIWLAVGKCLEISLETSVLLQYFCLWERLSCCPSWSYWLKGEICAEVATRHGVMAEARGGCSARGGCKCTEVSSISGGTDGDLSSASRNRVVLILSHDEVREVSHCQPHSIWEWHREEKGGRRVKMLLKIIDQVLGNSLNLP